MAENCEQGQNLDRTAHILQKIASKEAVVGIMGLGYVGLPLAATFHKAGFTVIGFDNDKEKVEACQNGTSYLVHIPDSHGLFKRLSESPSFSATTDSARLGECDAILICVPTPLGCHFEPDLSFVENCAHAISATLKQGQLIVLESTTYPGTTRDRLLPIMQATGLSLSNCDFYLAFSPEREDPGNVKHEMYSIPKIVGGVDPASGVVAETLYKSAFKSVHQVKCSEVAEASKLVENIYRAVNIALVNELKMVLAKMDIDIWEVLDAAETKPFGFHRFNPGPGWGGHCIPVDPFYLTWKARSVGMHTHFIEHAGEINLRMPNYVVQHVQSALNEQKKPLNGSKILLIGIAYKPNIGDTRETPAFIIWGLLHKAGADVIFHDPLVPVVRDSLPDNLKFINGQQGVSEAALEAELNTCDGVVIVTPHSCIPVSVLAKYKGPIIDTRNWVPDSMGLNVIKA